MKKPCVFIIFFLLSMVLASETESTCHIKDDCPDSHDCVEGTCTKESLFPLSFRDIIGTIFILTINALMTAGGVGAGAAYVPYTMLILQTTLKQSVRIGYACVFGGGIGNLVNIIRLKNPKTNRFIINYNTNMIILPALMIGVLIGMVISRMLPPFVTNLILLIILGYSIFKNYHKLKANLAKERNERAAKIQTMPIEVGTQATIAKVQTKKSIEAGTQATMASSKPEMNSPNTIKELGNEEAGQKEAKDEIGTIFNSVVFDKLNAEELNSPSTPYSPQKDSESGTLNEDKGTKDSKAEKRELLYQQEQKFPLHKLRELSINFFIIVVIGLIRGTKNFDPVVGVEWTCGWDFLWLAIAILAFGLVLARSIYLVKKWQKAKVEVEYEFLPEDPLITKPHILKLTIGATIAGIIGALVALGGAMIIGPILLDMGIPPSFSAATTGVFMIFSMFNAMFQSILNGDLTTEELAWFLSLSFVFSFVSSKVVNWYVKKTGKQSTVILLVKLGASLGFLCLLAIFIKASIEDFEKETNFTPIC